MSLLPTGTVTLLFTDIEGSMPLWEHMPDDMRVAVAQHHAILQTAVESNGGQVFQILGDAFQAAFRLAIDGLNAAIQAQRELQSTTWGKTGPLKVRMGLHTGPLDLDPHLGPAGVREYAVCHTLNRASRVMSASYGGQILVSQETQSLLVHDLPEGMSLRDMGYHQLKGMRTLEHLYQVVVVGLPQEFPALATDVEHPHNLPVEMTSFVGRESEILALKGMLSDSSTHLVTIIGAGGMGKTRLALKVAEELMDKYEDGIWLIELTALSNPALVPQVVAQTLNIRELPNRPIIGLLEEHLLKKHMLLVLDNCEHLILATMELSNRLLHTCPHLQIIATSRELLGVEGEKPFQCPSLSSQEKNLATVKTSQIPMTSMETSAAVKLFADRASVVSPSFRLNENNIPLIYEICQRVDGIPLAIELAAARVRMLSVDQIAVRLDDVFQLLVGGSRSSVPHHQTLKALIDWSYDLLTPAEKTLLVRLSVFSGGWDLQAAEAIGSGDEIDTSQVLDLMTQLKDKSLILIEAVNSGENRYRMLETLRQYASKRLLEVEEYPSVNRRHLEYYSYLAEQAAPHLWEKDQPAWIQRLTIENDNLRGALRWAFDREQALDEEVESGARMAAALWNFWYAIGTIKEGANWLAIAVRHSTKPNQTRGRLLAAVGTCDWQLGNLSGAADYLKEALDLFSVIVDPAGLAEATHMYGHIVFDRQDYAEAGRLFKQSLTMYDELGDTNIRVALISDLGLVASHQGDLHLARDYYKKSLKLSLDNGLRDNQAQSYLRLGDLARLEGDYDTASEMYQQSLNINRDLNISREIACSLYKLGHIALHRGELNQAQTFFGESLALQQEVSNQQGIAECLAGFGSLKEMGNEDEPAAFYFGAARAILNHTGLPISPADRLEWERAEKSARSRCDPRRFNQAYKQGVEAKADELVAALLASLPFHDSVQ
jgi:predicted ATPase/class 3 adenylate cyclase